MSDEGVVIHRAAGEFDAQQIKAFLEAHEIPCTFKGEALRNVHGFTLNGLGEVSIVVPTDFADRARDLLRQVQEGELKLDDTMVMGSEAEIDPEPDPS
jgi:hypothetical protein